MTPETVDQLTGKGKVTSGSRTDLARVGVGVMVRKARTSRHLDR